ncbi:BrnA antitoxin family protein [bacterium]|nr:BrnA antitoxin family protein [bacterium]
MRRDMVTREPKVLPNFASEEEELLFWDTHDPSEYFTVKADFVFHVTNRPRKRMLSIRVDDELRADLKAIAEEHDVPYQALMREILRQGVKSFKRAAAMKKRGAAMKKAAAKEARAAATAP